MSGHHEATINVDRFFSGMDRDEFRGRARCTCGWASDVTHVSDWSLEVEANLMLDHRDHVMDVTGLRWERWWRWLLRRIR